MRKAAATSIGHLVKVVLPSSLTQIGSKAAFLYGVKYAKESSIEKLISRIRTWYLEKEGTVDDFET